jgi:hypothetical protein
MECLMTLLWATYVIDREQKRQDQALRVEAAGAVAELRRACRELDELFRARNVSMRKRQWVSFVERAGDGVRETQKSFGHRWSLAFKQDDSMDL